MSIFSKFFGDVKSHIIRYNAGKEIKNISELFIEQKKCNLNLYCFQLGWLYIVDHHDPPQPWILESIIVCSIEH